MPNSRDVGPDVGADLTNRNSRSIRKLKRHTRSTSRPTKKLKVEMSHDSLHSDHFRTYQEDESGDVTFDFFANLPLNVLQCIVRRLSVIDTLIMCRSSSLLDNHISMLHDVWKSNWFQHFHFTNEKLPLDITTNWKAESERALALLLKFSKQAILATKSVCLLYIVTAVDCYKDMVLCFGHSWVHGVKKVWAHVYQRTGKSWKSVIRFLVKGSPVTITTCSMVSGYKIFAGTNEGCLYVWDVCPSSHKVRKLRVLRAHSSSINCICPNEDAGIVATSGKDNLVQFWNLKAPRHQLESYVCIDIKKVKILTGEKSPFIGYNCALLIQDGPMFPGLCVGVMCWGKEIELSEAVFASSVLHPETYEVGYRYSEIFPDIFVQGGSIVYGLKLVSSCGLSVYNLVWQPLVPADMGACGCRKEEVLEALRRSLHPCRPSAIVPLPEETSHVLGVGKYFSVCVTKFSRRKPASLTLIRNRTGDSWKLSNILWNYPLKGCNCPAKLVSSEWLDGLDNIKPGSICVVLTNKESGLRISSWKKNALARKKVRVSDLLAIRESRRYGLAKDPQHPGN